MQKTYTGTLSGTTYVPDATTYPGGFPVGHASDLTLTIVHPDSVTTTYTIDVSNMSDDEVLAGGNDWADYSPITDLVANAASKNALEFVDCGFARVRLKQVTSSGSGTNTVRACAKQNGKGG